MLYPLFFVFRHSLTTISRFLLVIIIIVDFYFVNTFSEVFFYNFKKIG